MEEKFDFIGDVHGSYKKLSQLLEKLGYKKDNEGIYFHDSRIAFFLGDVVDGGDEVIRTFYLVKRMVEKKYAMMIMGNHEINLLAINSYDIDGSYLRERNNQKLNQSYKSLPLIFDKKNADSNMDFLINLPLFYESENIRAIHACWHPSSIQKLKILLSEDFRFKKPNDFTRLYLENDLKDAMEKTLKGIEFNLPDDLSYIDKYGHTRTTARHIWWKEYNPYIKEKHILPSFQYNESIPVIFGHYWQNGLPKIENKKALCIDYSAMKGGNLCAYRFNGETEFKLNNLFFV